MNPQVERFGMGWLPDYPDFRDYTIHTDEVALKLKILGQKKTIKEMLDAIGLQAPKKLAIPPAIDLRSACSPIEDQQTIGSCTAHAGVGLVEYFERQAFHKYIDASRLFLYKVTRNMMHLTGDTGAYLRTTMGAIALFGVPPEEYWQYVIADYDKEPPAFCYAFAQNYQAISYYRLDAPGTSPDELLKRIKLNLAAKLPSMFGFTVYESITQANQSGEIPFPAPTEQVLGGHAIDAVGYDDAKTIKNKNPGGKETIGALIIRNSWGKDWGDKGYGWLPYEYVLKELAIDWWSLIKNEWIDTGQFGFQVP
jgi:C1A family cysteine protease